MKDKHENERVQLLLENAKDLGLDPRLIEAALQSPVVPPRKGDTSGEPSVLEALENLIIIIREKKISPYFDEEALVEREILPLWEKIYALCEKHSIPVLFAVVKSNLDDNVNMAMGNVLIKKRTDTKFFAAKAILSSDASPIGMTGSDMLDLLDRLKNKAEIDCSCDECAAVRAKKKETIDA